ncbi:MAG: T9SS type A sorting domain-containing protein, partial [Ignavibacteriaceae bacterium]|nr:T9SS type A sorting domain-containing protein [Ignavibacteriaceae bacterium]
GENVNVTTYAISQNYPNPFNPTTTIRYAIPQDGLVTLKVYDILGKEVKTLVNEYKTKGRYEVTFDANNLASGLYIYEITSGSFKTSKKMTLIK